MIIKCDKQGTPIEWVQGKKLQIPENYSLCRCEPRTTLRDSALKVFSEQETVKALRKIAKEIDGPIIKLKMPRYVTGTFLSPGGDIWQVFKIR
jgi:hypothetical protein